MRIENVVPAATTTRPLYKMEHTKTANGESYTRVQAGTELVRYRADVIMDSIEQMARRAAGNKSGKCVDGAIVVTVIERRRL